MSECLNLHSVVFALLAHILKNAFNLAVKQAQVLLIQQHLSVGEPGLDPLLKTVDHIDFHARRHEHELYLAILQHIQALIQQHLLCLRYVEVYILKHEQECNARILHKELLNLCDHLHSVELFGLGL